MSIIFGKINIDGKPIQEAELEKMAQAMSIFGPDRTSCWHEENAGLGHLQLYNTPESINETHPLVDNTLGLVFISSSRIDNREELCNLMGIVGEEAKYITDARLIFAAYRKWGNNSVNFLLGDWSFAVWHTLEKKLFLARDHYGITSLYYTQTDNSFYFSTSINGLKIFPELKNQLNEQRIVQIICGHLSNGKDTVFDKIKILPPAHWLTLSKKIKIENYWDVRNISERTFNSSEEVKEEFLSIFKEAVKCRLRSTGNIGSMLSGGVDSSSVSAIAATELDNIHKKLYSYTSIPKYEVSGFPQKHRMPDEGKIASLVAEMYPNIYHQLIADGAYSLTNSILLSLKSHGQPINQISNSYWKCNILEKAKNDGCKVILEGQHGNHTISWPPLLPISSNTPSVFIQGNTDFLTRLKRALPADILVKLLKAKHFFRESHNYPFLNMHNFSSILSEIKAERDINHYFIRTHTLKESQIEVLRLGQSITGAQLAEIGMAFGIEVRDPTCDKRIIEFCLSLPDKYYVNDGKTRLLIKNSFKGLLPETLLNNQKRGRQSADIGYRVHSELEDFKILLNKAPDNNLSSKFINFANLKMYIKTIENNQFNLYNFNIMNSLIRIVSVEQFLKYFVDD